MIFTDGSALGNPRLTGAGAVIYHSGLEEEERDGCFALIVLLMSCFCSYSVALLHGAMGWSAVCGIS